MEQASSVRSSTTKSSHRSLRLSSTHKQPSFDTTALSIAPSPLMTSSLYSRNSATSAEESVYLYRAKWLRWSRLVLALSIIATGVAAAACTGHVVQRYNSTHLGANHHLPLWPLNVDLRPTLAVMISAAIATGGTVGYLVFSLVPTPHSRTLLYNVFFAASSVIGLVLCIFALSFNLSLTNPSNSHRRDSLQSWTCKFSHGAADFEADAKQLQLPVYLDDGMTVPAGFRRLCSESEAATGLMIALLVMEFVGCAISATGIILESKIVKARRLRYSAGNERREKEPLPI